MSAAVISVEKAWASVTLGDLCKMYQPETITKSQMKEDGPFPVFGANGVMGRYDRFNHEQPQLVVGCRGACGTVYITEPKSWITGNSMVIQPDPNRVDIRYLRYFFEGPADLVSVITGAAQPQITQTSLRPVQVPLPQLEEQKRIVAVLDQAFAALDRARAHVEANLADSAELFDRFLSLKMSGLGKAGGSTSSGVDIKLMRDIVTFHNGDRGKNYPNKSEYVLTGVPWINTGHIMEDGSLSEEKMNYISEAKFKQLGGGKTEPGDLVFCLRGATIGKTAFVGPYSPGAVASSLMIIRPGKEILDKYAYYFLTSELGKSEISRFVGGAAQPNLAGKSVGEFKVPLPSIERQKRVVECIDAVQQSAAKSKHHYLRKLQDLAALRQSLLQKAFSGQMT